MAFGQQDSSVNVSYSSSKPQKKGKKTSSKSPPAAPRPPYSWYDQHGPCRLLPAFVIIKISACLRLFVPALIISTTVFVLCSCSSSISPMCGRGPDCPSSLLIGLKNAPWAI